MTATPTRKGRRSVLPVGAALALSTALLLSACGGGDSDTAKPTPDTKAAALDEQALGKALEKIVYSGSVPAAATDEGACFVNKIQATKISDEALIALMNLKTDDKGAAVAALSKDVDQADAEIFGSLELREAFDLCVDAAFGNGDGTEPTPGYTPTPKANKPDAQPKAPDTKAKFPVDKEITSATQLEDGLVSMMSSYAIDDEQKQVFTKARTCMAEIVFKAGLSQPALKFLAGGAPLGSGSIADQLASDADRSIWVSSTFTTKMSDCIEQANQPATQ